MGKIDELADYFNTRLESPPYGMPTVGVDRAKMSEALQIVHKHKPWMAPYFERQLAESTGPSLELDRQEVMKVADLLFGLSLIGD